MDPAIVISTILKHDRKVTSYKIALLRAINDIALSFPDITASQLDVAVPLRAIARFWIAYYWPFVHPQKPIEQGQRRKLADGRLANDMAFRPQLSELRAHWEETWRTFSSPSDGYYVINELLVPRRRSGQSPDLLSLYDHALRAIAQTTKMPICHAGPGQWTVFEEPVPYTRMQRRICPIPGTQPNDECLVIRAELWRAFQKMSLYLEALCIHEWCLFTEEVSRRSSNPTGRGEVYRLLTSRPDNRRPLTWERNQVDVLLMEGKHFVCPWTERKIRHRVPYDLDHLLPVSLYPMNEMWNLVPSDPHFNTRVKRDRLPGPGRLLQARPHLTLAYANYESSAALATAIHEDACVRFANIPEQSSDFPSAVADAVTNFIDLVAECRNIARF